MAFTYDISTNIGKIRLIIQDKDIDNYIFEDEELSFYLGRNDNNITRTAIEICRTLAMKFMQGSSQEVSIDDITIREGSKHKYYLDLAKDLENQLISGLSADSILEAYFGGVYEMDIDDNNDAQEDGYIVKNSFKRNTYDTFYEPNE